MPSVSVDVDASADTPDPNTTLAGVTFTLATGGASTGGPAGRYAVAAASQVPVVEPLAASAPAPDASWYPASRWSLPIVSIGSAVQPETHVGAFPDSLPTAPKKRSPPWDAVAVPELHVVVVPVAAAPFSAVPTPANSSTLMWYAVVLAKPNAIADPGASGAIAIAENVTRRSFDEPSFTSRSMWNVSPAASAIVTAPVSEVVEPNSALPSNASPACTPAAPMVNVAEVTRVDDVAVALAARPTYVMPLAAAGTPPPTDAAETPLNATINATEPRRADANSRARR